VIQGYYRKALVMIRLEDEDSAEQLLEHCLTMKPREEPSIKQALAAIRSKTPEQLV
jgi:hypothetical protein